MRQYWQYILIVLVLAATHALAADGDLDTTFSGDGKHAVAHAGYEYVHDAAIYQSGTHAGKIVMVGVIENATDDFAILRLNPDGTPDTGFSTDGWVTVDFLSDMDRAWGVAIQADDKIVVVGEVKGTKYQRNSFSTC